MLVPSDKQWKKWSLPSKLTAVGTLLGLLSLVYALSIDLIGSFKIETYQSYVDHYAHLDSSKFNYDSFQTREEHRNADNILRIYAYEGEFDQKLKLTSLINASTTKGDTIFIRLKMYANTLREIENDSGYRISLPKYDLTKDEISYVASFGYGPEKFSVFLDGVENSKSGFDEVFFCKKTSMYHLSGFYKFTALGQAQGFKSVHGRLISVDPEMATNTIRAASESDVCYEL
ncbi:hypothetical protein C427_3737 [Paraglaciecola psychrophila 170]|uniref:Uncharacterized protein n=2 Tax=Paraglaciecola TaxID=1621534 RepID=M4RQA8_9ALTE|nr:hypothetical protein C427_3737 [Paraglaciecola psychrophila 170]